MVPAARPNCLSAAQRSVGWADAGSPTSAPPRRRICASRYHGEHREHGGSGEWACASRAVAGMLPGRSAQRAIRGGVARTHLRAAETPIPDSAPLHPGYDTCVPPTSRSPEGARSAESGKSWQDHIAEPPKRRSRIPLRFIRATSGECRRHIVARKERAARNPGSRGTLPSRSRSNAQPGFRFAASGLREVSAADMS